MQVWRGVVALGLMAGAVGATACGGDQTPSAAPGTGGQTGVLPDSGASPDSGKIDTSKCGNGVVDSYEDCDDGNTNNADGCTSNCRFTCVPGPVGDSVCGDGDICDGAETCGTDHICRAATSRLPDGAICGKAQKCLGGICTAAGADCGDTLVVPPEECDPPDGVGCSANCKFTCLSTDTTRNCKTDDCIGGAHCNDTTHTCITGTPVADLTPCGTKLACVSGVCSSKYCSNGTVDPGEECDDGNVISGDGCDANCKFTCKTGDTTRDCHAPNSCFTDGTCTSSHVCTGIAPKTAGAACGTGKDCVAGTCVAIQCGDGIVAVGVEACDDGNLVDGDGCDGDCTKSCSASTAATDCPKTPACRTAQCNGDKCDSTPNSSNNGNSCTTIGGTQMCHDGACTSVTCGDGNLDGAEQCDFGSDNGQGKGCEADCLFSCNSNADCDPCQPCGATTDNGKSGKKCGSETTKADGTACGTGRICLSGGCRLSVCGDGHTDTSIGEQCDPPNNGGCDANCKATNLCNLSGTAWAMKVSIGVSWGDGTILAQESNQLFQWARLDAMTQNNFQLTANLHPCGISIPDFLTTPGFGAEWFGLAFPANTFDAKGIPSFPMTATLSNAAPGATVTTGTTIVLLGVDFTNPATPLGTWTDSSVSWIDLASQPGVAEADQDGDGNPGITAIAKTGPLPSADKPPSSSGQYADVRAEVSGPQRADQFYLAVKQVAFETGTLDSCTTMHGNVSVSFIDNHVIGCRLDSASTADGGTPSCGGNNKQLVDGVRPQYTVSSATFKAMAVDPGSTCQAVRAALP